MAIREPEKMLVHSKRQAQIEVKAQMGTQAQNKVKVGALLFDKALTAVPAEYFDYNNVFLAEYITELLENTKINKHAIKLKEGKQSSFGLIYSLGSVELEMLKTDIKTNLVNSFIWSSKSLANASILFNQKPDKSLYFCVDY